MKEILLSSLIMPHRSRTTPEFNNCLCTAKKINALGHLSVVFCQFCFDHNNLCVVMDDYKKCAHCTCCGHPCVSVLWDSLDRARDKLKSDIQKVETNQSWILAEQTWILTEQTCVAAKLDRLRKTLRQTKDRAKVKTLCLLQELSNDEEAVKNPSAETLSQIFNAMPMEYWQSNPSSPSQNIKASSHSSWGFVLVPKLTLRYHILSTWQGSELSH